MLDCRGAADHFGDAYSVLPAADRDFSDHTGFASFFCEDFTEHMPAYSREWEKLGLTFDGAATGFLGSARQIDIVKEFLTRFKTKRTKVLVDPVMGDYGKLYPTYTQELAGRMHELLRFADLLTPNLTEACILAKEPYREDFSERELTALCARLAEDGPQEIVISRHSFGAGSWELCLLRRKNDDGLRAPRGRATAREPAMCSVRFWQPIW